MFDYNPFREFKQMMKEQLSPHIPDPDEGFDAGAEGEITARINSHADSSELLAGLKSDSKFAQDVGNHHGHLHHILRMIGDERNEQGHGPGTRFSPHHDELIKFVTQAPAYHPVEHGNIIHNMEHKIHDQPFSDKREYRRLEDDPSINYEE